jgi:Domain of unknown function (DUF1707)
LRGCLPENSRVTLPDPSDISRLRISDADRDRAASFLGDALAEGRLTAQEHAERLDVVYAAKTQADIVPAVSDLPGAASALAPQAGGVAGITAAGRAVTGKPTRMVAVLSGIQRKGAWRVPQQIEALNVVGGTELDLREAILPAQEIRIRSICILGGMQITVPPEMHVIDNGWALLGGREIPPESAESASPDAPVLRLTGVSILGGLEVRRKRRKGDGPRKSLRKGDGWPAL